MSSVTGVCRPPATATPVSSRSAPVTSGQTGSAPAFPAVALPEARQVVAADYARRATHPRVVDLAREAVTDAAWAF
ncbi:hypothetical protein CNMCM6106_006133 [Aspergillus hiratsukae]|uniref:Uncharacterized protein n=1 Tax=Aspergillus hiratsukae TaxID=1194566 RepID=A0A8H6QGW6_9EURO|nr:hypothetical protein CNMCM6106_006133 [Aspergillus hiratsukae]